MVSSRRGDIPRSSARALPSRARVTPTASSPSTVPSKIVEEPNATTTKVGTSG